jgi:hypothetical protein
MISGTADASARPPVPVSATTRHPVTAPGVLQPGLVHLRNKGRDDLVLFRRAGKAGINTLLKALNSSDLGEAAIVRIDHRFPLLGLIAGKSDIYVRLTHGTYYLIDGDADHYHRADIHVIHVNGKRSDAKAPFAHTITLTRRSGLRAPAHVRAGHFVYVRNTTRKLEGLLYLRIRASATTAQIQTFLAKPTEQSLSPLIAHSLSAIGDLGLMSGGHSAYVRFPRTPARYLVIAISPTSEAPSLVKNQIALITAR